MGKINRKITRVNWLIITMTVILTIILTFLIISSI